MRCRATSDFRGGEPFHCTAWAGTVMGFKRFARLGLEVNCVPTVDSEACDGQQILDENGNLAFL